MFQEELQRLAQLLAKNRQSGTISALPLDMLQTEDEALSVQADAISAFADDAVGYAIVGGSPAVYRSLGIDAPIYGPIPAGTRYIASDHPFRLPGGIIGAQCDLVFTMGAPLGDDHQPVTRDMFCAAALTCQPAIVLLGRRGHLSDQPRLAAIADFALHVATFVGKRREMPDPQTLARLAIRASIDGRTVLDTQAVGRLADPVASAVWLVNDLIKRDRRLRAGDIVSTGALAPILLQVLPGQELEVEITDIGRIATRFV